MITWLPFCRTLANPCFVNKSQSSAPAKTRNLGMRQGQRFHRHPPLREPFPDLIVARVLKPQLYSLLDHGLRILLGLTLANNVQLRTKGHEPPVFTRFNDRG